LPPSLGVAFEPATRIVLGALPFVTVTVPVVHAPFGNPSWPPEESAPVQVPYPSVVALSVTDLKIGCTVAVATADDALHAGPASRIVIDVTVAMRTPLQRMASWRSRQLPLDWPGVTNPLTGAPFLERL
jgi:hypothetical protein